MSALAGRWNFDGKPGAGEACGKMLAAQEIYGPHHGASWDGGPIALGRRLFRILPEDVHDRAPQLTASGRYRLVGDVRLDNRDELNEALGIAPARAATLPDAAYLLAAWEKWEESCFERLLGDYAFALWDSGERRLVLARDHIGTRPLHYHRGKHFFAFASMPKGLHTLPEVPYAADDERTVEFLALLPETGPRSFFEGIDRVEQGQFVTVTPAGIVARRHWRPRPETIEPWRGGDPVEALRAHLDRAVAACLRGADNRVGAHLSGGLDSSSVAATAARLLAPAGGKVVAFTSVPREGYDGPDPAGRLGDEGPLAAATAALYPNMEHVLVRPEAGTVLDGLDRDFFLLERPLLHACNHRWINAINSEARRRGLKVLLTGQLGNFTISYPGMEWLPELAGRGRWLRLLRESRALVKAGNARWRGAFAAAFGPWTPLPLWKALARFRYGTRFNVEGYIPVNQDRDRELDLRRRALERGLDLAYRPRKEGFHSRIWALHRTDPGNFNKGWLGGWGVDVRDPTGDRRLIEFCLSLPMSAYLSDGVPRALGTRAMADRLPPAVLGERRKGLQAIDWHEGMTAGRDGLRAEVERLEQIPSAASALNLARMRRLIEDWPTGDWNDLEIQQNYRHALLRGIASGHFLRKASRSNA